MRHKKTFSLRLCTTVSCCDYKTNRIFLQRYRTDVNHLLVLNTLPPTVVPPTTRRPCSTLSTKQLHYGMTPNHVPSEETSVLKLYPAQQCWIKHNNHKDIDTRTYVDDAAALLHAQWPRGGSTTDYKCKLLGIDRISSDLLETMDIIYSSTASLLPCSYLLIDTEQDRLVGHGRLTECFEGSGGNATAATYIITEPRRMGYGSILMKLLEHEAIKLGYHYMYLWTTTAIPFYQKLQYTRTERISLNSACLKTIPTQQIDALEAMLAKRSQISNANANATQHRKETVTLPPDAIAVSDNDVWLRKRLVESIPSSIAIPLEHRLDEIRAAIRHCYPSTPTRIGWDYFINHNIPWQQQIGPSCGLAALRMLREYYVANLVASSSSSVDHDNAHPMSSLLNEAQTNGYTTDGEIFNIHHMIPLAEYCGLINTRLQSFRTTSAVDICDILLNGGTLIVPYDSQPFTKKPCWAEGKNAHYGIIVGVIFGCHHPNHTSSLDGTQGHADNSSNNIEVSTMTPPLNEISNIDNIPEDSTYILLVVQHGLSNQWTIAPFKDVVTSNEQLHTIDTTKCCQIPTNTKMNLRDQIIIVNGTSKTDTNATKYK